MKGNIFTIANKFSSPSQLSIAAEVIKVYNCRASEILSAKWEDYQPGLFLILEGKKKSANVVIRDRQILSQIDKLPRIDSVLIFPSISYSILYHHFKSNYSHLFKAWKKRKNHKVTHGFRYKNVSKLDNDEKIREVLHHRSTKSGQYYKLTKGANREKSKKV